MVAGYRKLCCPQRWVSSRGGERLCGTPQLRERGLWEVRSCSRQAKALAGGGAAPGPRRGPGLPGVAFPVQGQRGGRKGDGSKVQPVTGYSLKLRNI